MKKTAFFLFFFLSHVITAQYQISGLIIDHTSLVPIENAIIYDTVSGTKVQSDSNGSFNLLCNGVIEVTAIGYQTKKITITSTQRINVALTKTIHQLQEVLINNQSIPLLKKYATDAVVIVNTTEIQHGNTTELHPILNKIPGVFMQNGTLNTNRITIRGIGARNLFGTANIRAYFGDIPLTDGNGASAIEDLELAAISSIEIHKGPSASSYGVGLGGTILLHPETIANKTTEAALITSFGSYGLQRNVAKIAVGRKKSNMNIVYSNTQTDGYRENNTYNRNTLTATAAFHAGEKNKIELIASYIDLKAQIPSSLDQEDFTNNPRHAAFTWGQAQGFEDVGYGILGVTWKHNYSASYTHHTSIFSSFKNNYEPRPFNILEEKSNTIGVRSRVTGNTSLFQHKLQWTAGGELFLDFYNNQTFENLYQDFPSGTGSVLGNQLSDLDEKRNYYNLFAETNFKITDHLRFNIGIHVNQTFFDIDDNFLMDTNDSSGSYDFDPIVSPKIGINYTLNPILTFFGNIAHGFSTPTASETLLPDGEFNSNIKPEIGWNYEIGTRYSFLKGALFGSLSVYSLNVSDLLVSRRTKEDNFFAINAGKTIHNGLETTINYRLLDTKQGELTIFFNTAIHKYTFNDFVDLDADFSGNDLTGVPSSIINIGLDLTTTKGIYGNLNFQTVGEIPANDQNTVYSDAYDLVHGKIGYKNDFNTAIVFDLSFGANNILNTSYASQLQVNARGFGNNAPRYFYPGVPFNVFGGLRLTYSL